MAESSFGISWSGNAKTRLEGPGITKSNKTEYFYFQKCAPEVYHFYKIRTTNEKWRYNS